MEKKIKVFVSGCTGRMGKMVVDLVNQHPNWEVCGGLGLGERQYDFPVFHNSDCAFLPYPDIIVDFSTPDTSEDVYNKLALIYDIPMVCATTKLPANLIENMKKQTKIPVFQAYNLAYDVYVFTQAVAGLVAKLPGCDIDIIEVHHTKKKDAPSGTAITLAEAINSSLGHVYAITCNPDFNVLRKPNEIHIHSRRSGSVSGKHTVEIRYKDEYVMTFEHDAISPKIFVAGAIKAAEFLLKQPAGYYTMKDL